MRIWLSILFFFFLFLFFTERKEAEKQYTSLAGTVYSEDNSMIPTQNISMVADAAVSNASNSVTTATIITNLPEQKNESGSQKSVNSVKTVRKKEMATTKIGKTILGESKNVSVQPSTSTLSSAVQENKTVEQKSDVTANSVSSPQPSVIEQKSSKKEMDQPANSVFTLNTVIKNSDSTYYFTDKRVVLKDVTVNVISITPYKDKDILKFTIENGQTEYFFISTISIYDQKTNLSAEIFFKPLVNPGNTMDCIALIPRVSRTQLSLVVTESSGKNRTFTVKFITT